MTSLSSTRPVLRSNTAEGGHVASDQLVSPKSDEGGNADVSHNPQSKFAPTETPLKSEILNLKLKFHPSHASHPSHSRFCAQH